MSLSLYQDLKKNISEKSLNEEEKNELIKKIKKLDDPGHELIYALIKSYQIEYDQENKEELPYLCKELKTGLKFDLEKIPDKCLRILIKFCEKHLEKMKEEQKLMKGRK